MMPNHFLIKRNPEFTTSGVIVKRKQKDKRYSETVITHQAKKPSSAALKVGDTIFVAETNYGIYAKGTVIEVSSILEFHSVEETLTYIIDNNKSDNTYWIEKLKKLHESKIKNSNTSLKYHEYFIDQELLDRTIPLVGSLERLSKPGFRRSVIQLTTTDVANINNPIYKKYQKLDTAIPPSLRMDIYSLLNKEYAIQYWIDIDHFVPKSTGGPGNILENLVPVGMSINRHKNNAVPKGLFETANQHNQLKVYVLKEFLDSKEDFLRATKYKRVIEYARKINEYIARNFDMKEAKSFYFCVLEKHLPLYAKIIESLNSYLGYT